MRNVLKGFFAGLIALCLSANIAHAALSIDAGSSTGVVGTGGSNANTQTTLATPATYTLSNANDISVVGIMLEKEAAGTPSCTSVSDGTNTYTIRNRLSYSIALTTASNVTIELWWAYSATTLTNATVTATCGGGSGFTNGVIIAFGVTGFTGTAYHTNPWDQGAATALGWGVSSTNTTASAIVSNSYANSNTNVMLIGIAGTSSPTGVMNAADVATLAGASTTIQNAANNTTFGNNAMRGDWTELAVASGIDTGTATMNVGRTYAGWAVLPDILAAAGGGGPTITPKRTLLGVGQ